MFTPTVYIYIKETCTLIHGNKPATDVYVPYQKIRALHIECLLTQGKPFANMAIKKKKKPSEKHGFASCKCSDSYVTEFTSLHTTHG